MPALEAALVLTFPAAFDCPFLFFFVALCLACCTLGVCSELSCDSVEV